MINMKGSFHADGNNIIDSKNLRQQEILSYMSEKLYIVVIVLIVLLILFC